MVALAPLPSAALAGSAPAATLPIASSARLSGSARRRRCSAEAEVIMQKRPGCADPRAIGRSAFRPVPLAPVHPCGWETEPAGHGFNQRLR